MATVNTASVREEIARVEQEIARLSETGKVSDESRMLFNALLMIVNMLVAIFMESSTKKTSKNSSIPPSQTTEDQSSKTSVSNKKGPAQNDELFDDSRTVETETVARVNRCSACGENLSKVSVTDYERRTRIDIVFEKCVEHVDAEIKHCPCCHHVTKGQFPSNLAGPVQYGLGSKAYILNLLITQMVSLNRVQKLLKETCAKVSKRKRKKLTENEYANLQKRYRNILTRGISELPARPERPRGKRSRLAQSNAQNLWDRMYEHEYAVLLFAYTAEVPLTNNRAERDLRTGKVKQKVSGCFRQEQYAAAYYRISSYLRWLIADTTLGCHSAGSHW